MTRRPKKFLEFTRSPQPFDEKSDDNGLAKDLVIKDGKCGNENARILLDSGATCFVVKPGLLKRVLAVKTVQVKSPMAPTVSKCRSKKV
ncbi:hypothetical protein CCR75_009161 [Bremia lactucae]|uniref:Uncharacterized protein n=1 Tax=Bremia lactucae TaxID=4779 RepID=A0A976IJ66_BRELC|nr:hypothetical protein CCR75_009161 [Bremia lactucae]